MRTKISRKKWARKKRTRKRRKTKRSRPECRIKTGRSRDCTESPLQTDPSLARLEKNTARQQWFSSGIDCKSIAKPNAQACEWSDPANVLQCAGP